MVVSLPFRLPWFVVFSRGTVLFVHIVPRLMAEDNWRVFVWVPELMCAWSHVGNPTRGWPIWPEILTAVHSVGLGRGKHISRPAGSLFSTPSTSNNGTALFFFR